MKLFLMAFFAGFYLNHAVAADADEGSSLLLQSRERKYSFQTYEPSIFYGLAKSLHLKNPIYKILPLDGQDQGKPFFQDIKQKFANPKVYDRQQVIEFFREKTLSIIIGQNEVVVGKCKPCDLVKFIADPVFVGTIALKKNTYIHLTDLLENQLDRAFLKKAYYATKDFFPQFDVLVHNGETSISEIDTIDDGFYVDER